MLVLSRKESQRIRLGDSIVITVVRINRDKVRLGIEAPRDLRVLRDELDQLDPAGMHHTVVDLAAVAPAEGADSRDADDEAA